MGGPVSVTGGVLKIFVIDAKKAEIDEMTFLFGNARRLNLLGGKLVQYS